MARRSFTPEQIIHKLRAAEVFIAQGLPVQQAARQMDVSQQTYDRWRLQQKPTHFAIVPQGLLLLRPYQRFPG